MAQLTLKKRLGVAAVIALALWPAFHFALYQRYGIDPWMLCGWAMYARPHPAHTLEAFRIEGGREVPVRLDDPAVVAEAERLNRRRATLGSLASPEPLAAAIRRAYPDLGPFRLRLRRIELDCGTARLDRFTVEDFDYGAGS